jgi:hypothetical protein
MPHQLSQQQLALVLRRAAELERKRREESSGNGHGLSEAELKELVDEVGIPSEDVNRALAELRTGILPASEEETGSMADRLVGPAELAVERVVRGDVGQVEQRVQEFLRAQLLEVRRDFGDRVQWRPAQGLQARIKRGLNFSGRIVLPSEAEIESLVAPVPGESGKVVVRLLLRVGELRSAGLRNMGLSLTAGVALAVTGFAAAHGLGELALLGGGAATALGGSLAARGSYQRTLQRTSEALAGFLDTLEHRRG